MVQILPQKTNVGTQIGQALGQGLQQGIGQGFQRGMLQNALKGIENLDTENTTPFQLASALLRATAGHPGSERYVGTLYPILLQQLQNKRVANIPPPGGTPAPGEMGISSPEEAPQSKSLPSTSVKPGTEQQLTRESFPIPLPEPTVDLFGNAPEDITYGAGPRPLTYSPEEYASVEKQYRANGLDPAPAINFMRNQDEVARNRYQDILKGTDVEFNLQQRRAQSQARVRDTLQNQLGITDPRLLAVADMLGRRENFAKIPDEFRRAEAIRSELNKYVASEAEFKIASQRPNPLLFPQKYKTQKDTLKNIANRMIEYGQRDQVFKDLADNGWSETEIAESLNPLPSDVKKKIDAIPHYAIARSARTQRIPFMKDKKETEAINKANQNIQSVLEEVIKPGKPDPKNPDVLKPGTSLILLKKALMKKGLTSLEIDNLLSNLVEEKKIKLDAEQARELNVLTGGPYRTESIYELVTGDFTGK